MRCTVADEGQLDVEVAYAKQDEQVILSVKGAPGLTVRQAIEQSGVLRRFPEIDLASTDVGVFGKLAKLDSELQAGDRVEIYRPLVADPKEQRKKRAAEGKELKKRG
jgi:putative ubiquitin-RnfH superfamily antitoxin RatB of RatAB toxin-antitoxin module